MSNIVAFLTARFDEREAWARAATPGPWMGDVFVRGDCVVWGPDGAFVANSQAEPHWTPAPDGSQRQVAFDVDRRDVTHIAANDPAHVLADIASKRAIVAAFRHDEDFDYLCCLLAAPFAAHPDFDPAWRL